MSTPTKVNRTCDNCGQVKDCTQIDGSNDYLCDDCKTEMEAEEAEGSDIEIEEVWQPTPEQQKELAEKIQWETAFKNILRKDISAELAKEAIVHFKELVGDDTFVEIMFRYPDLAGEIGAKIFRQTVRRSRY